MYFLLGGAMCDLAAALNPASGNFAFAGWDCSGGIPLPTVICGWGQVACNSDLSVTQIVFGTNFLVGGTLPTSIGSLTALTKLLLTYCSLTGIIPTSIGAMKSLDTLNLSGNKLTGIIPASIGGLSSLKSLNVGYNMLTGVIPSSFCDLHLEYLALEPSLTCYPGCLSSVTNLNTGGLTVCTTAPTGNIHIYTYIYTIKQICCWFCITVHLYRICCVALF